MAQQNDWREIDASQTYTDEAPAELQVIWEKAFPAVDGLTVEQYHALIYLVGEAGTTFQQAAQQVGLLVNRDTTAVHTHVMHVESAAFNLDEAIIETVEARLQESGYYDWMDEQLANSDD